MKLPQPQPMNQEKTKWYIQVMLNGKRTGRIFYGKGGGNEASAWAANIKAGLIESKRPSRDLSVGEAMDPILNPKMLCCLLPQFPAISASARTPCKT